VEEARQHSDVNSGPLVPTGEVAAGRADEAIADLTDLDHHRHAHLDLVGRAWKLRDSISAAQ
jgi:hypothetical protein